MSRRLSCTLSPSLLNGPGLLNGPSLLNGHSLLDQNVPSCNVIAKSAIKTTFHAYTALMILGVAFASASTAQRLDVDAIIQAFASSCDGYSSDEVSSSVTPQET